MTTIDKFIGTEFRSRYVNPTWIEGMKKEGYAGAGEMRQFVEYLWGWDATVTETVDDVMWKETFGVYVEDKHKLGMKEFFEKSSPFAYQDITARMLETVRKEYWKADEATQKRLLEEYVGSVNRHGVGCAEHTCGNPRLQKFVMDQGRKVGIPVPALEGFQKAMEQATQEGISAGAERLDSYVQQNDAKLAARLDRVPAPSRHVKEIEGLVMEERTNASERLNDTRQDATPSEWQAVAITLPVLGLLLAWRWKQGRVRL
jgi:cobaltochelatase CobN